jgi:hypothetical protein
MAQFFASVIVSNRLWGCAFIGVSFVAEFAVLFLLPATTTGPLGPINNRIYGTFFSALMLP